MLRPTGYLTFELNEESADSERAGMLNRAFSYVCPVTVVKGERNDIVMRVDVDAHPYWDCGDSASEDMWCSTVRPWLATRLKKVQETLQECNNEQARSYACTSVFDDIVLEMDGRTVKCAIIDDQLVQAAQLIDMVRKKVAAAPEGAVIQIPSDASGKGLVRRSEEGTATLEQVASEVEEGASEPAQKSDQPRRLNLRERDALRRNPIELLSDFTIVYPDGESSTISLN